MARKSDRTIQIDSTIGENIWTIRLSKGMSRQQLSDQIDCTHQQTQKYEKGTNRISGGRLQLIANAFGMEVGDLFPVNNNNIDNKRNRLTIELVRGFNNLNPKAQEAIVKLVRSL